MAYYDDKLLQAVGINSLEEVNQLLAKGADPNCEDGEPLSKAYSLDVLKALLAAGADVNRSNSTRVTPIMWAAGYHTELVATLIAAGADINAMDHEGQKRAGLGS